MKFEEEIYVIKEAETGLKKPKKRLYTAVCIDIQVKNTGTQGGGETRMFGSKIYMKNTYTHADIH
uniref:Uncharacterized protein n=1 Tax=Solanum tuberosum TaxID=4113 RepID=M1BGB1_SOLTU